VPCCGAHKLPLHIFISVLLQWEGAGGGSGGNTAGPSSCPQEDVEANRGAIGGHGNDTARNPAEDLPKAIEDPGNEV
jgi:hypothetical protein